MSINRKSKQYCRFCDKITSHIPKMSAVGDEKQVCDICSTQNVYYDKMDVAILDCYVQLFKRSEPVGNFHHLMDIATINKRGQKEIPFMDYEIDEDLFEDIVSDCIKRHKIKPINRQSFRITILMGCSPKFKR